LVSQRLSGGTPIPLRSIYRTCDFTPLRTQGGAYGVNATALSGIHTAAGTVTPEVHLSDPGSPGTHYDVRLIQLPRASESPCGPGDPGVAIGGLDTDGAVQATTTLQDRIRPGATGVWMFITRPSQFSQDPAEFYTSEVVAPV
jgi:hypothetical protein